jgi:predicted ATPase/transcriptional regulator with XRE-family HTH domain
MDDGLFRKLLRQHRLAAGLTQEGLAERASMSARAIQNLERGDRRPYPETALRLAGALGLEGSERSDFDGAARPRPRVRTSVAPTAIEPAMSSNLPNPLTACVGREADVAGVRQAFDNCRLVTLVGPGGAGKTRLALEIGHTHAAEVWFVELDAIADPGCVASAVADALGVSEEPGKTPTTQLCAALRARRLLLVLDNAEHVRCATASLVEALLGRCPELQVLVTSRQPLGLTCERVHSVKTLEVPPPAAPLDSLAEYPAVQLFLERGRMVQPDLSLTPESGAAIVSICRQLDGVPMALELAAARLRGLSVQELAHRLEDPLQLLTSVTHRAAHQKSLRATIDWSYALLDEKQRQLLRWLSVFSCGWTLEAAEGMVGGACADALLELVDHSLVQVELRDGPRYRLLETVRQYAFEHLSLEAESDAAHAAHFAYYLGLLEQADADWDGPAQARWAARLDEEQANLRTALRWAFDQKRGHDALRLAGRMGAYWHLRGHRTEGLGWLEGSLCLPGASDTAARALALRAAGRLAVSMRNCQAAEWLQISLKLCQSTSDTRGAARTLVELGHLHIETVQLDRAIRTLRQAATLAESDRDRSAQAHALLALGQAHLDRCEYAEGIEVLHKARRLLHDIGDTPGEAAALQQLAMAQLETGDATAAELALDEAQTLQQQLSDALGVAWTKHDRARLALDGNRPLEAAQQFGECVELFERLGHDSGLAWSLLGLGRARSALGEVESARRLFEQGLTAFRKLGHSRGVAWALYNLAWQYADAQRDQAWPLLAEAMAIFREQNSEPGLATSLLACARLTVGLEPRAAARWLGLASTMQLCSAVDRLRAGALAEAARDQLGASSFQLSWTMGSALSPRERDLEFTQLIQPRELALAA